MARKIVAGNWKMNKLADEAQDLFNDVLKGADKLNCEIVICPPALYLQGFNNISKTDVNVGAQNVSAYVKGAYTGEFSAEMLRSLSIPYCIVGHSERRSLFGETDSEINEKIKNLLFNHISPIFCCGETLDQREIGIEKDVVKDQIIKALEGLKSSQIGSIVIAYEPVWAIGTGVTASTEQAQEMHAYIRKVLLEKYGEIAFEIPLLYGGSCKPSNARELFACKDIDGGLIGGASLEAASFLSIANSFS
ncbi:MAG: triose-phosphate isomerase [Flavobacteriales bacterium]|nr:triose-phosphate isomerase [Flavobacteriales bacterium]